MSGLIRTLSGLLMLCVGSPVLAAALTGSVAVAPGAVNLTAAGTSDWVHWGRGADNAFNRKAGIAQQISNYTAVGSKVPKYYTSSAAPAYSWTDGTPTPSEPGYTGGLYVAGLGNGYQFTVPADTTARTLKVYLGTWRQLGRVVATLSDASAPAVTLDISTPTDEIYREVTLDYSAASAGQTLTVRYTVAGTLGTTGNITLHGAALVTAALPVAATPTVTPAGGTYSGSVDVTLQTATAGAEIRYTTNGSDPATGSVYKGPITLLSSVVLKAQAFKSGYQASAVATESYTIISAAAAQLTGSLAAPASVIDLTAQGVTDWAHWGRGSATAFNHKAAVGQQISNFTSIGAGTPSYHTASVVPKFVWSDGTPKATEVGYKGGLHVGGLNNGFQFTVPADNTLRTLKVYLGVNKALGRLTASLSDGSAPAVTFDVSNASGATVREATLSFRSELPGQWLTLRYVFVDKLGATGGSVRLYGATLVNAVARPVVATPVISLPGAYFGSTAQVAVASATSGATIRYTLNGSDPATGAVYTGPLTLTANSQLRVQAFADGYVPSLTSEEKFVHGSCGATRLMPLGDSITLGSGTPATEGDFVGYRRKLYLDLTGAGANVNFVGTQDNGSLATGPSFDTQHEGHGGWTIEQVRDNVYNWLVANPADIVVLHIGTNNTAAGGTYTDPTQLSALLDEIDRFSPQTWVVLARIINEKTPRAEIKLYNQNLATMAGGRILNGDRLTLVDMESVLDYTTDMSDKLHPNITGYEKMATVWRGAVQPRLAACLP